MGLLEKIIDLVMRNDNSPTPYNKNKGCGITFSGNQEILSCGVNKNICKKCKEGKADVPK